MPAKIKRNFNHEVGQVSSALHDVAISVDIGGTKIRAAVIGRDGALMAGTRHPTGAARGGKHVLSVVEGCIDELRSGLSTSHALIGIGISSAGVIEPETGLVVSSAPNIPGWVGMPLGAHFTNRYSTLVVADNDANCALVGEVWRGNHSMTAGRSAVMLTLGTGLGGAMMVDGRLVTGAHHLTGHYGIARMWDPYSQQQVKIEHLVSGSGLGNVYRQIVPGTTPVGGAEVIERFEADEADARLAIERWCEHLALQIHNLHWIIDPDRIIIGGGMVDSRHHWWPLLEANLAAHLAAHLADSSVKVPLVAATLGNDAGVYGAARLVFDRTPVAAT